MVLTLLPVTALAAGTECAGGADCQHAAAIGSTHYDTLNEAVNAAEDGDTVTLVNDTDISKSSVIWVRSDITLDLNGKTLKAANTNNGGNIWILGATLTLKDSTDANKDGTGEGKIYTETKYVDDSTGVCLIAAYNNAHFVMESGLIDAASFTSNPASEGQFAVGVYNADSSTASLTVNGGHIKAGWYALSGNGTNKGTGNITVNGGIVESTSDYAIYHPQNGTTTINGGTVYGVAGGISLNRGNLIINDGIVTSKGTGSTGTWGDGTGGQSAAAVNINAKYGDAAAEIKGGKLTAETNALLVTGTKHEATITVTGGTFSDSVREYLADGYYQNENGTVEELTEATAAAKYNNTLYGSLVDAYTAMVQDAAANGKPSEAAVITLLRDSAGGGIGSDKFNGAKAPDLNYVIDFNGFTYTVGAPAVGSTGTVSQGVRVLQGSTATFLNGTLKAANYNKLVQIVHTYGDVVFEDFTVDASEDQYAWCAVEPDCGTLQILGNSSILAYGSNYGLYAAFWHTGTYDGVIVTVDTTGTITGKLAYELDEDVPSAPATKNKGFLNILNGNFDVISMEEIWTDVSADLNRSVGGITIGGGLFKVDPSEFCTSNTTGISSGNSQLPYTVGPKEANVEVAPAAPAASADTTGKSEEVANVMNAVKDNLSSAEASGLEVVGGTEATKITAEEVTTAADTLKNSGVDTESKTVTVYVQPYLDITVKDAKLDGAAATELTVEIVPMVKKVASTAASADEINLPEDAGETNAKVLETKQVHVTTPVTITLPLPAGLVSSTSAPVFVKHIKANTTYIYEATVSKDGGTYYATFTNPNGFSTFVLSATDPAAAKIGSVRYATFRDAVDAVQDGQTINILQGSSHVAYIDRTVSFEVVVASGLRADVGLLHGENTTVELGDASTPDHLYFTCVYTRPEPSNTTDTAGKQSVNDSAYADRIFRDVDSDAYYAEAVEWAYENGITNGLSDTYFGPDALCTRAQIITFLWRALGEPEAKTSTSFTDVADSAYYAEAVAWAVENGITAGTSSTTFSPDATCTRAQAVTFLCRAFGTTHSGNGGFADVPADAYYAGAVAWAVANGVTNGVTTSRFAPNNSCTRAQIVTFLYRSCK